MYSVPEGYFDDLKARLSAIPQSAGDQAEQHEPVTLWMKVKPYMALAASFTAIVLAGNFVLKTASNRVNVISQAESFEYAYLIPETNPYAIYDSSASEGENVSSDDIVNYLIDTGVPVEKLEMNYE